MLLETLENSNDNLIIYSRNILNHEENFRMILKNDPRKKPRKLFLYDICGLINHPVPKNVILYRLLINIPGISLSKSEAGCLLNTPEGSELFYPDPIFAVNELEQVTGEEYLRDLRFRIQQVGLSASDIEQEKFFFREVFSFDLSSLEAQAQNDSVFLSALLLDENVEKSRLSRDVSAYELITDLNKPEYDEDEDLTFHSLAGVHITREFPVYDKPTAETKTAKSEIDIFKSIHSLGTYLKHKLGRKKILRFR